MPSIGSVTRQIPTGLHFYNPGAGGSALDFIPTSGNYVGHYPPGFIVNASQTGLNQAIADAFANGGQVIQRDMGKTIFAPYATSVTNGNSGIFSNYGYYRQLQLIFTKPIVSPPGFIGGVGGNTFGVVGPAPPTVPGTSTYLTLYLPVSVESVGNSGNVPSCAPISGGQM